MRPALPILICIVAASLSVKTANAERKPLIIDVLKPEIRGPERISSGETLTVRLININTFRERYEITIKGTDFHRSTLPEGLKSVITSIPAVPAVAEAQSAEGLNLNDLEPELLKEFLRFYESYKVWRKQAKINPALVEQRSLSDRVKERVLSGITNVEIRKKVAGELNGYFLSCKELFKDPKPDVLPIPPETQDEYFGEKDYRHDGAQNEFRDAQEKIRRIPETAESEQSRIDAAFAALLQAQADWTEFYWKLRIAQAVESEKAAAKKKREDAEQEAKEAAEKPLRDTTDMKARQAAIQAAEEAVRKAAAEKKEKPDEAELAKAIQEAEKKFDKEKADRDKVREEQAAKEKSDRESKATAAATARTQLLTRAGELDTIIAQIVTAEKNGALTTLNTFLTGIKPILVSAMEISRLCFDPVRTPAYLEKTEAVRKSDEVNVLVTTQILPEAAVKAEKIAGAPQSGDETPASPEVPNNPFSSKTQERLLPVDGRWVIDFGTAITATTLRNRNYFVGRKSFIKPDQTKGFQKIAKEGKSDKLDIGPAIMAHAYQTTHSGIQFGPSLGIAAGTNPRYLTGMGFSFGRKARFSLLGGMAFGKVEKLNRDHVGEKLKGGRDSLDKVSVFENGAFISALLIIPF